MHINYPIGDCYYPNWPSISSYGHLHLQKSSETFFVDLTVGVSLLPRDVEG